MGDMADYHEELSWAHDSYLEDKEILLEKKRWELKDGTTIKIKKMETSHIQNCLNLIAKHKWRTEYIELFKKELKKRNNGN